MAGQRSFILRSPFVPIGTRNMRMADSDLAAPPGAVAGVEEVIAGEWLAYDEDYMGVRGTTQNVALGNLITDEIPFPCFPAYFDPGETDVQALGVIPVLFNFGKIEVDTMVYEAGDAFAMGDAVCATQVTDPDGATRCGLSITAAAGLTVGYVQRLPADNNNYLRVRLI